MGSGWYILDDHGVPQHEPNMIKAIEFLQKPENKIVAKTQVGPAEVSTVFLSYDHGWTEDSIPIVWETMVFGGRLDQQMMRCGGTREQAEAMHEEMIADVLEAECIPVDKDEPDDQV